ncbi:MAG: DUF3800 domain-containing protein [Planctomycetota bacterium]|jgi:hypothetical protein
MVRIYNIYCDESCHLENDQSTVMVIGALWSLTDHSPAISKKIVSIKEKHGLKPKWECKWTKVSQKKIRFYLDLIDYFFDEEQVCFRGILITEKGKLQHDMYSQSHDEWYYKMLFQTLNLILDPVERYRVYIDIKDTHSARRAQKLREILCNAQYDFDKRMIERVQPIKSHESALLQLADLIIGAIAYCNRGIETSLAKKAIVDRIKQRSGITLTRSTYLGAKKFNLFKWRPGEGNV